MTLEATDSARREWGRRVAMEYAVCGLAQDFARRLTEIGAPAGLIRDALRMAGDELEHAVLAQRVLEEAGSDSLAVFDPGAYKANRSPDALTDITMITVSNLCLGETLAVRVTHGLRANATVPTASAALRRIVTDEPRHAALGWQTLDWLLQLPTRGQIRATIDTGLEGWIHDYEDAYAGPDVLPHLADLGPDDLSWGLAEPDVQRHAFRYTFTHDWGPRLARRGFTVTT